MSKVFDGNLCIAGGLDIARKYKHMTHWLDLTLSPM